ncbi:CDP-alcohol phosphatidyltransferase family protein [Ruegeria sp. 2205SS24-7]|uniref:CDP-alcohol phosphatidyltransferase family protein n=1 Tax=Ruegeria discodermiae TaxID=3064389 RepID=UPI002741CC1C|nr:CDP-alcohol phosphatidyltransferase family protein [Ruegeria sp. 2205SS24-7]MDP5218864.1 CDP-alcohol phosphatidyltransferase family protein [Ruegeria sp. 2205SS24-7]
MFRNAPHLVAQTPETRKPLVDLLGVAAVLGAVLALAAHLTLGAAVVPLLVFVGAVTLVGYAMAVSYPHPVLGACNAITLMRMTMVAFLAGALVSPSVSVWVVFGVASVAFALDGADGWLARRAGLVSDFGGRFDMETDAALGAAISLWLLTSGTTGPEILILGFMRYAFVGASFVWPALQAPLPQSFRRKTICVIQIATLIMLIFPLTPQAAVTPVIVITTLLLSWSFLVDIFWLARRAA